LTLIEYDALLERHSTEQEWLNYRPALICALLANINRDPKSSRTFSPQDFMPWKKEVKKQDNSGEFMQRMIMLGAAMGARVDVKQ